jgi:hypothetical protein
MHKNRTSNHSLKETAVNLSLDNCTFLGVLKKSGLGVY